MDAVLFGQQQFVLLIVLPLSVAVFSSAVAAISYYQLAPHSSSLSQELLGAKEGNSTHGLCGVHKATPGEAQAQSLKKGTRRRRRRKSKGNTNAGAKEEQVIEKEEEDNTDSSTNPRQCDLEQPSADDCEGDWDGWALAAGATVAGLQNPGNSCFFNSILQSLASLNYLHAYLTRCGRLASPISIALRSVTSELRKPRNTRLNLAPPYNLEAIISKTQPSLFRNQEQQDAQELYVVLADILQTAALDSGRKGGFNGGCSLMSSLPAKKRAHVPKLSAQNSCRLTPLTGILASRLSCCECGYNSAIRHSLFSCLQLSMPMRRIRGGTVTLHDCLGRFIELEELDGVTCPQCASQKNKSLTGDRAGSSTQHTKQLMIARAPRVLALHINRSFYGSYGDALKDNSRLDFPLQLNITPYVTAAKLSLDPRASMSVTGDEGVDVMAQRMCENNYALRAVVLHGGTHDNGHYAAYVSRGHRWFYVSDDYVAAATEIDLGSYAAGAGASMLFYELEGGECC